MGMQHTPKDDDRDDKTRKHMQKRTNERTIFFILAGISGKNYVLKSRRNE